MTETKMTPTFAELAEAMAVSLERIFDLIENDKIAISKYHWSLSSQETRKVLADANKALQNWRKYGA